MVAQREKILVVEDEADILELMLHNLRREGYALDWTTHGEDALRRARLQPPDLLLLDRMLPGMSGMDICRQLKSAPETRGVSVVMVTARTSPEDVCAGLEVGADDYIPKPFSPRVLIARVRAVLRRRAGRRREDDDPTPGERIELPGLVVDGARHEVKVDGQSVTCTATEFRLLHHFASNPGRVFTRAQLLGRVVGESALVIDRNVDVHVGALRKKLGEQRERIETIRGVGYRFKDGPEA